MAPAQPRRASRRSSRGQALVETAIVVIVVMTLFIGVYACAVAISDSQQAGGASRSGARFAAQIGSNGYKASNTPSGCQATAADSCAVDKQIVNTVLGGLNNGKVSDASAIVITIYEPCTGGSSGDSGACPSSQGASGGVDQCVNGTYNGGSAYSPGNDYGTQYTIASDGTVGAAQNSSKGQYDLSLRTQTHPKEAAVGVQVDMTYASPTPFVKVTAHLREFTINCLAPAS